MEIRKTTPEDIHAIMAIVQEAQNYFRAQEIPQWQNGYPNEEQFLQDIKAGGSYVLCDHGQVIGTCFIHFAKDPNYQVIENGRWLNDEPYGVIHRIAISSKYKGKALAKLFFQYAEDMAKQKGIYNMRADTHEKNRSMQKALLKNGFVACGVVYMSDGAPRIAYHKVFGTEIA